MKISFELLFQLLLVQACCEVIEKYLDIPASLNKANVALLTRVNRHVELDYRYALATGGWAQYPDMNIYITLAFPQEVQVHENIAIGCNNNGWFATRIKINGVEVKRTRRHTAFIGCPTLNLDDKIYLPKGTHRIVLEYRTSISQVQDPNLDWYVAYFRVSYYQPPSS